MNIGIDIDGVLTDVRKFVIEEGSKYCKEHNKGELINPDVYEMKEMFGWNLATIFNFWRKNIFKYAKENPVIDGASENIKKLKEDGHKIYIITARWLASTKKHRILRHVEKISNKMKETVINWLNENNIIYDEIIFSKDDKSKHIIKNNIDIMIEDAPDNVKELSELTKVICYDWVYNRGIENKNIYRCSNWDEIYKVISELSNNSNK